MPNLVTWSGRGGISFFLSNEEMRGIKDINISTSSDVEDQEEGGEKFVKRKNSGSYQISLTVILIAALGVDVRGVALSMTEAARCGDTGYFYVGESKLFPSNFMATDAKINDIRMTGNGTWTRCEVTWTLRQCGKFAGPVTAQSTGGSGGTGGESVTETKQSVKSGVTQSQTKAAAATTTTTYTTLATAKSEQAEKYKVTVTSSGNKTAPTADTAAAITKSLSSLSVGTKVAAAVSTVGSLVSTVVSTTNAAKKASSTAYSAMTGKTTASTITNTLKTAASKITSAASKIVSKLKG